MIKFLIIAFVFIGCSSVKEINGKKQSFGEYVIMNSNSKQENKTWRELEGDSFPGLRLKKWINAK